MVPQIQPSDTIQDTGKIYNLNILELFVNEKFWATSKQMWQNSVPLILVLLKKYYALKTHQCTEQATKMDSASLPHFPELSTVSGLQTIVNKCSMKEN